MTVGFAERAAAHYYALMMKAIGWMTLAAALALCPVAFLRADQVVMQNGDTYNGTVLSATTNAVVGSSIMILAADYVLTALLFHK